MNPIQRLVRFLLLGLARLHPYNWIKEYWKYPILYWIFPVRDPWAEPNDSFVIATKLEKVCRLATGHELSEKDWYYKPGSNFVHRKCRWCGKLIYVPKAEEIPPKQFRAYLNSIGEFNEPE